jgi:hypothetical protein
VVIQKEMKYFFSSITQTGLVTMDNDAKSCYDRIICNLAMIISQYFGIKSTVARTQAITLKKMHFRLRTALGDSINHYSHSDDTPVHGTGQGSCASPSLWLIISSILMDCFYQGTFGVVLSDKANPILTNYGKLYSCEWYESSYRSEAYGMLAGIISLKHELTTTDARMKKGRMIILFCDNKTYKELAHK